MPRSPRCGTGATPTGIAGSPSIWLPSPAGARRGTCSRSGQSRTSPTDGVGRVSRLPTARHPQGIHTPAASAPSTPLITAPLPQAMRRATLPVIRRGAQLVSRPSRPRCPPGPKLIVAPQTEPKRKEGTPRQVCWIDRPRSRPAPLSCRREGRDWRRRGRTGMPEASADDRRETGREQIRLHAMRQCRRMRAMNLHVTRTRRRSAC